MSWSLHIRFKSEVILGSGQSLPGEVDNDVLRDSEGFPFYRGKTLKGHWRENTQFVIQCLCDAFPDKKELKEIVPLCFGIPNMQENRAGVLHIMDAVVRKEVRAPFIQAIQKGVITPDEVFSALTDIRSFTAINSTTGTIEPKSLRKFRVVRPNLELISEIDGIEELEGYEIGSLALGIASIKNIGMMKHRGKGEVQCFLYKGQEDVTTEYIQILREWVKLQ